MEFFEGSSSGMMALGKTLVHSLWVGLLLLSILKAGLLLIPVRHSNLRYRVATSTLLLFLASVATVFGILYTPLNDRIIDLPDSLRVSTVIPGLYELTGAADSSPVKVICYICSYIYFSGILVILIRSIFSIRNIKGLKRSGSPVRGEWLERFLRLKNQIGVSKRVELLISDRINVPALFGLVKPAIIVPAGMLTNLPVNQVETILMHELYHLRRLDFLVNIVQLVLEGLFFYNPAVWAISRVIRIEREKCCDDRVLQMCKLPMEYASALFQLAQHRQTINTMVPGAGGTDQQQLFIRIKRILNQTTMKTNIREKLFALLLLAGGMVILLTITGFSSGFSIVQHNYYKQNAAPFMEPTIKSVIASDTIPIVEEETLEEEILEVEEEILEVEEETLEVEEETLEALEDIDWEEIRQDMEAAKLEALEDIDWEEIRQDMEAAKLEALEDIDWEEIRQDMEAAKLEALEDIDWEEIKEEMAHARIHMDSILKDFDFDFDFDFDMEDFKVEMKEAMKEMKAIDWEDIRKEMENSRAEIEDIDFEQIRKDIEKALEGIDIEEIKKEIERSFEEIDLEEMKREVEKELKNQS
ncbi:MAG: hypothetical protein KAR19_06975 [Bacteroidales bacterium]|nr:hypothetical protein [Bacteroidales bacterium]